jgi:hypothetical protein
MYLVLGSPVKKLEKKTGTEPDLTGSNQKIF